jgi:hypothetical protein
MIIYYNIKGGKQVSYIEVSDDMEGLTPLENDDISGFIEGRGGSDRF